MTLASTEMSGYEEAWMSTFGDHTDIITAGLLTKVTHALVFETGAKRSEFTNSFLAAYPTGVIVAGGTHPIYKRCIECFKTGRPVFIFEGHDLSLLQHSFLFTPPIPGMSYLRSDIPPFLDLMGNLN